MEPIPQVELQLSLIELFVLVALPLSVSLATFVFGYFQHKRANSQQVISNQREAMTILEGKFARAQDEMREMRAEIELLKRDHRQCMDNNEHLMRKIRELEERMRE